ncbi:MAG: P-loop NTPase, partial [Candidatus Latescibacteria bacterium]|nr:P-loop NTPase [Candidatus Latescibacterota bacterium]
MKLAISAIEGHINAEVDPRFGRAAYFLIVDTDTMAVKAIRNPNLEALLGAGIQSAELVAREGAEVVLTGECGVHAFAALSRLGVKVVTGVTGRVSDAVRTFTQGNSSFASEPNIACPATCSAAACSTCQSALAPSGKDEGATETKAVSEPEDMERLIRRITDEVLKRLGPSGERTIPEEETEGKITVPSREKLHPGLVLAVASGKGGTGKTTVAVSLALSLKEPVHFLDCDVEEPNAHLFIQNAEFLTEEIATQLIPVID